MKAWALPGRERVDGENGFDPLMTSLMRIQVQIHYILIKSRISFWTGPTVFLLLFIDRIFALFCTTSTAGSLWENPAAISRPPFPVHQEQVRRWLCQRQVRRGHGNVCDRERDRGHSQEKTSRLSSGKTNPFCTSHPIYFSMFKNILFLHTMVVFTDIIIIMVK